MNKVITIPEKLAKKGDLVLIPRSEYEELSKLKKIISVVEPDNYEKKAIKQGRAEIRKGKYITLNQLKNELAD